MNTARKVAPLLALIALTLGCSSKTVPLPEPDMDTPAPWNPDEAYTPRITPGELSPTVDNPLLPMPVGARWVLELTSDEGVERTEIEVLSETREVWGVTARVVRDTVYLDGEMIEDTWDWFAQDTEGNVWYLGEETYEYENGEIVCDCGAWESGVDGALPGIVMLANPQVGDAYREEYLAGEAEDLAEIVGVDESVTVPAGTYSGCVRTRNISVVERDVEEFKLHCPGVGTVLELEEGERVELMEHSVPASG